VIFQKEYGNFKNIGRIKKYTSLQIMGGGAAPSSSAGQPGMYSGGPTRPVFQPGMGPNDLGEAYRPINRDRGGSHFPPHLEAANRAAEAKSMEEAEDLDMNASIHGNWTVENAKSKLHQYMQMNRIQADYKYKPVGPDHNRSRIISIIFFIITIESKHSKLKIKFLSLTYSFLTL